MEHHSCRCTACRALFNQFLARCPQCQTAAKAPRDTARAATRLDIKRLPPPSIAGLLEQAGEFASSGQTAQAVEVYREATRRAPTHPDAWRELGVGYAILKQFDRSLECNEQAMQLDPHDPRHWDHKAVTLGRMGNFLAGLKVLEEATGKLPNSAVLRMRLGYFLCRVGHFQESLTAFEQALELDGDDPTICLLKSQPEKELGLVDQARKSLEQALLTAKRMDLLGAFAKQVRILIRHLEEPNWEHDPVSALYAAHLGTEAWTAGDAERAMQCFLSAASFDPTDPTHWYHAASCARQLTRWEDSALFYERAAELLPHFSEVLLGQGHANKMIGRWDKALECFAELIELDPKNPDHWRDTGFILHELKRFDESLRHYDMSIELDPEDRNLWLEKSLVLDSLGRSDDAQELRFEAFSDPEFEEQWVKEGLGLPEEGPRTLH